MNSAVPASANRRAFVIFLIGVTLGFGWLWRRSATLAAARQQSAATEARRLATAVRTQLTGLVAAAETLAGLVGQGEGRLPRFSSIASNLLVACPGIAALELEPHGVTTEVVPLTANQRVIGFQVGQDPLHRPDALTAYQSRQSVITGPVRLADGEPGFIARHPVFLRGRDGRDHFWGLTAATMPARGLIPPGAGDAAGRGFVHRLSMPAGPRRQTAQTISVSTPAPAGGFPEERITAHNLELRLAVAPANPGRVGAGAGYGLSVLLGSGLLAGWVRSRGQRQAADAHASTAARQTDRERERFRLLWDATTDALVITSATGRIEAANPRMARVFGSPPSALIGQPLDRLLPADAVTAPLTADGASSVLRVLARRLDAGEFPAAISRHSLPAPAGGPPPVLYTIQDLSALEGEEAALREVREQLREVSRAARLGTWERDFTTDRMTVSDEWLALLGITRAAGEATASCWADRVHPDDRAELLRNLDGFVAGSHERWEAEFRLARPQRGWVWIRSQATVRERKRDGTVARLAGVDQEITETRELRRAEQNSTERLRLLLDSTSEGVFGVDTRGDISFVNPAACRLLGYQADELLDQPAHRRLHHHRPDGREHPLDECAIQAACAGGRASRVEGDCFWRKDGVSLPVEYTATPALENHAVAGAVVCFTDVTLRQVALQQLADRLILQRTLLNVVPHPMFIQDADGRFLDCNPAYEVTFGGAGESRRGRAALDLLQLSATGREVLRQAVAEAGRDLGRRTCPVSLTLPDGASWATTCSLAAVRDAQGRCAGLVGLFMDAGSAGPKAALAGADFSPLPANAPMGGGAAVPGFETDETTPTPPSSDCPAGLPAGLQVASAVANEVVSPDALVGRESSPRSPTPPAKHESTIALSAPAAGVSIAAGEKPRRHRQMVDKQLDLFAPPPETTMASAAPRAPHSHHVPVGLARLRRVAAEMERLLTAFDPAATSCLAENLDAFRALFTAQEFPEFAGHLARSAFGQARPLLSAAAAKSGLGPMA